MFSEELYTHAFIARITQVILGLQIFLKVWNKAISQRNKQKPCSHSAQRKLSQMLLHKEKGEQKVHAVLGLSLRIFLLPFLFGIPTLQGKFAFLSCFWFTSHTTEDGIGDLEIMSVGEKTATKQMHSWEFLSYT